MKKSLAAVAIVLLVGFSGAHLAEARYDGPGNSGRGYCNGPNTGWGSDISQEAHEAFIAETEELRTLLLEKRNEYFDAMSQENPDKEYAALIWGEMFDLKEELREKAEAAGIEIGPGMAAKNFPGRRGCGGPGSVNCSINQEEAE